MKITGKSAALLSLMFAVATFGVVAQPMDGDVLIASITSGGDYEFAVTQDTMAIMFEYAYQYDGVDMNEDFSLIESGGVYFLLGHGAISDTSIAMVVELEEMNYNGEDGLWLTISRGGTKMVTTCKSVNCTAGQCDPVVTDGAIVGCQPPCNPPATCERTVTLETTEKDWWEHVLEVVKSVLTQLRHLKNIFGCFRDERGPYGFESMLTGVKSM